MDHSSENFSRIISPVGVEKFFADYWEKKPLFIRRDDPGYFNGTLTSTDIDSYFQNQHISPGFLNVMINGEPSPPERWTYTAVKVSNNFSQRIIDLNKLLKLFSEGATIIINGSENAFSSLIGLRRALEDELKCFVQANVYITPPDSQGFNPHFDAHNVFILQIYGRKCWNIYDSPFEMPVRTESVKEMNYAGREPSEQINLSAGDLLYIPRGVVHSARAERTSSIHVTIGPMLRHRASLLKPFIKKAEDDARFRKLLPHDFSTLDERKEFETEFKRDLIELLEMSDLSSMQYETFIDERRSDNRGRFSELLEINEISSETVVHRRPFLAHLVERDEQWITIRFEGEAIVLPRFLEVALNRILSTGSFAVHEIEGIPNDAGKVALVKRFIQAGLLTTDPI